MMTLYPPEKRKLEQERVLDEEKGTNKRGGERVFLGGRVVPMLDASSDLLRGQWELDMGHWGLRLESIIPFDQVSE
jgi:hypothetical protein